VKSGEVFGVDVRLLTDQFGQAEPLPGVAFLVAREVVETAVLDGEIAGEAADDLMRAAEHLQSMAAGSALLRAHPTLVGQLIHVAETRSLPATQTLSEVRSALRELVRTVPPEGSVPVTAEYVGF
jgi:hypothetical protein